MSRVPGGVASLGLVLLLCGAQGFFLPNATHLEQLLSRYQRAEPHARARRAIPRSDREEILLLHNRLRGQVQPPASNMEHMVSTRGGRPGGHRGLSARWRMGTGPGALWHESIPWLCHSGTQAASSP